MLTFLALPPLLATKLAILQMEEFETPNGNAKTFKGAGICVVA